MTLDDIIHIDAPVDTVWSVTVEVERWPEWTPTVSSVRRLDEGALGLGSRVRIKQPGQPEAEWTVSEFIPNDRFSWQMERAGVRMQATHLLKPQGSGTANALRLEASGFLARMLSPVLRPLVRRALAKENRGLKARCEALARSSTNP